MVVAGPRLGLSHERSTQTIFLSGVNSTACTGGLFRSSFPLHSLNQLFTSVLPLGRRHAICRLLSLKSGESADGVSVETVSPCGVTSRMAGRSTTRMLPFFSGVTPHGFPAAHDLTSLPLESYSQTFFMSMCASRSVPREVMRPWRNCP